MGASLELLQLALEQANDSIAVVKLTGDPETPITFVYANPSFCRVTGFTREELLHPDKPLHRVQEDRNLFEAMLRDIRAGKEVVFEAELLRKDGSKHWTDVRCSPLACGNEIYYVTVCRDATDRRAAEAKRELLSRAIEATSDYVAIYDSTPPSQGGPYIIYANGSFCHALGYSPGEIAGMSYQQLLAPCNDNRVLRSIADSVEQQRITEKEIRVLRRDGTDFWIEFSAEPVKSHSEIPQHWIVVGRDISARRKTVEERAVITRVVDALPSPIHVYAIENECPLLVFNNDSSLTRNFSIDERSLQEARISGEAAETEDGVWIIPLRDRTGAIDILVVSARG